MVTDELVAKLVCDHLHKLGLKSRVHRATVEIGVADLNVVGRVDRENTPADSRIVSLIFGHQSTTLKTGKGGYLWDCSTGCADDPEQALSMAIHNWLDGVLPVVLAAHGKVLADAVESDRAYIYSAPRNRFEVWQVVTGAMQGNDEAMNQTSKKQPFREVLFQSGLVNGLFDKEFRVWALRCFVSRIADVTTKELRINWHNSEPLNRILDGTKLEWPRNSNPFLLRQFIALVPTNEMPTQKECQYLMDGMVNRAP